MWDQLQQILSATSWGWLAWVFAVILMLTGLAGTVLPIIPGHLLIFLGAALHKWLNPGPSISWGGLVLLLLLLIVAYVVDFLSGAVGAKWFGGSKWAVWGVLLGGIVGLFFGMPGLIIGPLAGGFAFELMFAKKKLGAATKSTVGTAVGSTIGIITRIVIGVIMVVWFFADVFLF